MSIDDPGTTHFYGDGCDGPHGSWADMAIALDAEKELADDLADVLDGIGKTTETVERNEIKRVLARYREARQR